MLSHVKTRHLSLLPHMEDNSAYLVTCHYIANGICGIYTTSNAKNNKKLHKPKQKQKQDWTQINWNPFILSHQITWTLVFLVFPKKCKLLKDPRSKGKAQIENFSFQHFHHHFHSFPNLAPTFHAWILLVWLSLLPKEELCLSWSASPSTMCVVSTVKVQFA